MNVFSLVAFLITVLVLAVSLLIISYLPIGVEVDSPLIALVAGAIIGILTGVTHLIPGVVRSASGWLTLGILPLIVGTIIFGLAAWLIQGFRLRNGIISAFLGALALAIVSSVLNWILGSVGLLTA